MCVDRFVSSVMIMGASDATFSEWYRDAFGRSGVWRLPDGGPFSLGICVHNWCVACGCPGLCFVTSTCVSAVPLQQYLARQTFSSRFGVLRTINTCVQFHTGLSQDNKLKSHRAKTRTRMYLFFCTFSTHGKKMHSALSLQKRCGLNTAGFGLLIVSADLTLNTVASAAKQLRARLWSCK